MSRVLAVNGLADVVVDGETVSPFQVMNATSPFSLKGLPAVTLRCGASREGLPISAQIASACYAKSTTLDVAE